jgi:hypothetical protein
VVVGVMGRFGVQGRLIVELLPDIDLRFAGLGLERGEAGNGDGLGDAESVKFAPVGRTSSRWR